MQEITERAMNGELDFTASLKERVGLLNGVSELAGEPFGEGLEPAAHYCDLVAQSLQCAAELTGFSYYSHFLRSDLSSSSKSTRQPRP
jgi:phosphoserine phosphatase